MIFVNILIMIYIKCNLQFTHSTASEFFEFSNRHEQNFIDLCEMTKEKIDLGLQVSLEEFLAYCCNFIANKIRMNISDEAIEQDLISVCNDMASYVPFNDVKKIQFEAVIDNKQKRLVSLQIPSKVVPVKD